MEPRIQYAKTEDGVNIAYVLALREAEGPCAEGASPPLEEWHQQ